MSRLFIDANVLVAVLNKEYPLFSYASRLLSLADKPDMVLYTSPVCLSIAFYFAEKKSGHKLAREKIRMLVKKIQVCRLDHEMVSKSLQDARIHDFEDGLEYYAAVEAGCDFIITENQEDFYFSKIEVCNCKGFLTRYFLL